MQQTTLGLKNSSHSGNSFFSGKTVFITGAGSGIGLELARALVSAEARVIATDMNMESLKSLSRQLGPNCQIHQLNVSDEHGFQSLAEQLDAQGSLPDIVINNAGIVYLASFTDTSSDMWKRTIDVNIMGVVHGCRTFIPLWQQSGKAGHLVNLASVASLAPMPSMVAYVASKYAVEGLTEALAMELVDSNIKVCCVHPGVINTPIVRQDDKTNIPAEQVQRIHRHYQEKGATPAEVADAILQGIKNGKASVFVGPGSTLAPVMRRILPRAWYRAPLRNEARKVGYL